MSGGASGGREMRRAELKSAEPSEEPRFCSFNNNVVCYVFAAGFAIYIGFYRIFVKREICN